MTIFSRRRLLIGGTALLAAGATGTFWLIEKMRPPIGFGLTEEELTRARALLAAHPAIDSHAHPGRTFVRNAENLSVKLRLYAALGSFEETTVKDMIAGGVGASVFSIVADFQVLDLTASGLAAVRDFAPGEALVSYQRQISNLQALAARGLVRTIKTPRDIATAPATARPGALFAVEGGDFLEGKSERVASAYADGVRILTIVHFRTNEIGDSMTGEPRHNGLTKAGADIVREMNRVGMVVDLAHASEVTARDALDVSAKPVLASHTHVRGPRVSAPRFISRNLAKAIASAGGLIGAWPAGIGISDLAGFVDRIVELVEVVGVDYVCLGTDMDANYEPVLDTYAKLPWVVGGLLRRGLDEQDVAKILRNNFLRVFDAVQAV